MEAFILMKKQNCSNFLAQINLSLKNGLCEIKDNQKRTMNNRITAWESVLFFSLFWIMWWPEKDKLEIKFNGEFGA